ncbi:alpha/beta fold hydrolase [Actinospongicola halichondriae]|uniref:alpha/beta fold hydrolase n=1 Tax=Actinospongicola halichondriae TaxID=3236844 RepID=UPI003D3CC998
MDVQWGERSMVDVDGLGVHVERAGPTPADGPAVVGLHGFASGTFTWAGVAPAWASRWPVVAWDRPPFGRSERPVVHRGLDDPYGESAVLRQAEVVIQSTVPTHRVVLVGHSAGTVVATALTAARSVDVAGVVLIAPALDGAPPDLVRRLAALPGASVIGSSALRLAVRGAAPALRRMGRHRTPLLDATAAETARTLRRPGTAEGLWHLTATWTPPPPLESLEPLGVPTMVIGGSDDRISSPASTRVVAEQLDAELHVLDGVGHAAHEQDPAAVGELVSAFVARLDR